MDDISIRLSRNDVGQLLEGINVLIEQWDATAHFLSTGEMTADACIRESSDSHEAACIAKLYRTLSARGTSHSVLRRPFHASASCTKLSESSGFASVSLPRSDAKCRAAGLEALSPRAAI